VHLSEKAVDPPGEARSDLDVWLDYARRMDFRDRDGGPLITWSTPEEVFEAWKACTRGRIVDYTGLTYDGLRGGSGIPWPVNQSAPDGTLRLYADGTFPTHPDVCETYGHDLATGGAVDEQSYRALRADGRAFLKAAAYSPPPEPPRPDYPLVLTTGRTAYHFHTRTKTGRAPQLQRAAPAPWVEVSTVDVERLGLVEGDVVRVESPRGAVQAAVRVGRGREGLVFVPFHYGYFDQPGDGASPDGAPRAANELTITAWDPVSKQPTFKVAAVRLTKVADAAGPAPAPTTTASAPAGAAGPATGPASVPPTVPPSVPPTVGGPTAEAREDLDPALGTSGG
jgi:anaerobic selenocysteine-containing dehydrogenase